jgi:hypothetical protein
MSLTYSSWVTAVSLITSGNISGTPSEYLSAELPLAIDYAEGRMMRDLELLYVILTETGQLTANTRTQSLPLNTNGFAFFNTVNSISVFTPVNTTTTRNQLTKRSAEYIDFMWPSDTLFNTVPTDFALISDEEFICGPSPDQAYGYEIRGPSRPTPLSEANPITFFTSNLPEVFLACTMIHISGYMKNFGQQADNPEMAVSWESQYTTLKDGADAEEIRKRYVGTTRIPPQGFDLRRATMQPGSVAPPGR